MDEAYKKKIRELKVAILQYLATNGRHYGELTREEQGVEDLAQALNTRLDQLSFRLESGCRGPSAPESPRERLANRFMNTAAKLSKGGAVDAETADEFEASLDLLDMAADLRRHASTVQDSAETKIFKHKRNTGK